MTDEIEGINWKWYNEEKLYKIYRDGRVFDIVNNKFVKLSYDNKKKIHILRIKTYGKSNTCPLHLLIYKTFNGQFPRNNIIGFRDKNLKNVHLDNLVLLKRNDKNNKPKKIHIPSNKKGDIENIDWKWLNDEQNYKIYKTGKIYSIHSEKFLVLIERENKTVMEMVITIIINNQRKTIKLSTTIWKLFVGSIEKTHGIYFKDNNFKNINLDNLYKKCQKEPMKIEYDDNEWTSVFGYENRYLVSKNGDIKSLITGKIMKCDSHIYNAKSYKQVNLVNDNKTRDKYILHRIVYSSFHKIDLNTVKDKVVDHINRNSLDNRLENLRLVSSSENSKNVVRSKRKKYNIQELSNDFTPIINYKNYDFTNYLINSHGQIKAISNGKGNKIHVGCVSGTNYRMLKLKDKKTSEYITVSNHILVACTFLSNPNNYDTVHHKDSNRQNNHLSNLEWTTRSQNTIYAIGKAVNQYSLDGQFIAKFKTIREAANSLNRKTSSDISNVCKGKNKTAYGFIWKYADEDNS